MGIGQVHFESGQYDAALEKFEEAAKIQIKAYGENDISVARILNCIGNVHLKRGEVEKSMQIFIEASRIYREAGLSDTNLNVIDQKLDIEDVFNENSVAPAA